MLRRSCLILALLAIGAAALFEPGTRSLAENPGNPPSLKETTAHRSPVDVVVSPDGRWLVTANETSDSISLIDVKSETVVDELSCPGKPAGLAFCLDGNSIAVSCTHSGNIYVVQIQNSKLVHYSTINIGYEPVGLAISPDGSLAYAGLVATGEVAEIDLRASKVNRTFEVGRWPRYLTVSPDGSRLAVGCSGESRIAIVETKTGEVAYKEMLIGGINIGHLQCSNDGNEVYFPWMVYRSNPITIDNIQRGWVLASRIARVRLDGPQYREAISLDVPRKAVADPHGIVMTSDEHRLVVSASGTHELLVYRKPDLPFEGVGGPGDLIDRRLMADKDLFDRIDVGGRPMGIEIASDDRKVYVANYTRNSIQVVDIEWKQVLNEIPLGEAPELTLARRGMELFHDGQKSLDQWYSCHTCHYNGGINSKTMDTMNDGTELTMKTVLPLEQPSQTGPWTWHGWQDDLTDAMQASFTTTMQGRRVSNDDARAVIAYLDSIDLPPNPFRNSDGSLTEAAERGRKIFESSAAGCAECHTGSRFTDGKIHDVGLGSAEDAYSGYNTPTLIGCYRKVNYLHDGRAMTLEDVLTGDHAPEKVMGERPLTQQELADLVAYLKSL